MHTDPRHNYTSGKTFNLSPNIIWYITQSVLYSLLMHTSSNPAFPRVKVEAIFPARALHCTGPDGVD